MSYTQAFNALYMMLLSMQQLNSVSFLYVEVR